MGNARILEGFSGSQATMTDSCGTLYPSIETCAYAKGPARAELAADILLHPCSQKLSIRVRVRGGLTAGEPLFRYLDLLARAGIKLEMLGSFWPVILSHSVIRPWLLPGKGQPVQCANRCSRDLGCCKGNHGGVYKIISSCSIV